MGGFVCKTEAFCELSGVAERHAESEEVLGSLGSENLPAKRPTLNLQLNPGKALGASLLGFTPGAAADGGIPLLPSVTAGEIRDSYSESKFSKTSYLILGGSSAIAGSLLLRGSEPQSLRRTLGGGLLVTGVTSVSYDLLDPLIGGAPMPRWYKNVAATGLGILFGLGIGFLTPGFNRSGLGANSDRNPVDGYGP